MIKSKQNKLLAVVGLPGSGKSEATKIAIESDKFKTHIYFPKWLFDELDRKGLPHTQENERPIRENIRKEHGMGAMAKLNMTKIKEGFMKGNVLIESMYSTEEYELLKKNFGDNFYVLAVYSSQRERIERLTKRPKRPLTKEEVVKRDMSQIYNLHQAGPIALADFTVRNEGTLDDLKVEVGKVLENFE